MNGSEFQEIWREFSDFRKEIRDLRERIEKLEEQETNKEISKEGVSNEDR